MDSKQKNPESGESQPLTASYTPSSLELKLKRQRNRMRKTHTTSSTATSSTHTVISQAPKKTSLMSVTRLQIPNNSGYQKLDSSPLVNLQSDDSDEDFTSGFGGGDKKKKKSSTTSSSYHVNRQLSEQLERDGFRLDEMPDDEDLDLIPPSEFRSHPHYCSCCNLNNVACAIL